MFPPNVPSPIDPMSAQETPATPAAPAAAPTDDAHNAEIAKALKDQVAASKRVRREEAKEWKTNVEMRLGVAGTSAHGDGTMLTNQGQSPINPDWSLTKTKTANLYSQVPTVRLKHEQDAFKAAVAPFAKALNYELSPKRANVGAAMEECMNDVVNASGIAAIVVGYAARFRNTKVAQEESITAPDGSVAATKDMTLDQLQLLEKHGLVHLQDAKDLVDYRFFTNRLSPTDILTPANFTGSDFNNADFLGYSGRMPWGDAKGELRLTDDQKEKVVAASDTVRPDSDSDLRSDPDRDARSLAQEVRYDRLYYWRHRVDPDETSFSTIWEIVFVDGLSEPVIHEPWTGQKLDEARRRYVGNTKLPVKVLTLTYVTDNPRPPSDSQAGRPQVLDLRRSRQQMFENRQRSIPIRWFDVNRIDPLIQDTLMRGTWQGMIPTNGPGDRSIGEIARASYPSEDFSFDSAAKQDLMESWQIGANQNGSQAGGKHTASEASIVEQNFATRIGQERGKVASFFLSVCEALSGWMVLYSDFPNLSDQERQTMQQAWDQKHILHDLVFDILPDSTIVLDVSQRIERAIKLLNMTVKSGYVNPEPIITEIVELSGYDPALVMTKPTQPAPPPPNISYRFTGKDDLQNPVVIAMLLKQNEAPSPQNIEDAKKLLTAAQQPLAPPNPLPGAPNGAPVAPGAPAAPPPAAGGPDVGQPTHMPQGAPDAHPGYTLGSRVAKRSRDANG